MPPLSDQPRVWLITGASSGLGMRFMTHLIDRGEYVVATARSLEKLEKVITDAGIKGAERLKALRLDVTDGAEKVKAQIDQAAAFWGRIDVLVNNAGSAIPSLFEEGGTTILRRQFETNVFGLVDVTTAVLPYLRKNPGSCLLVIGSRSVWRPEFTGAGHYSASKAAVHAITENLMSELSEFGVKVLLVEPGGFRTEGVASQRYYLGNQIPEYDDLRRRGQEMLANMPGHQPGDPDKAVEAVIDVVKGEGMAKDKPWPNYLILGSDAERDVKKKIDKVTSDLDTFLDLTRSTDYEE
ncbi:NAD(P)-binding protein [Agrocybe pediades]|nr:NAD(P)-binding protein [Agrocybe pediades]